MRGLAGAAHDVKMQGAVVGTAQAEYVTFSSQPLVQHSDRQLGALQIYPWCRMLREWILCALPVEGACDVHRGSLPEAWHDSYHVTPLYSLTAKLNTLNYNAAGDRDISS